MAKKIKFKGTPVSGSIAFVPDASFPTRLRSAVKTSLEYAGKVWEGEAKRLITEEDHVITGRYRNSVNSTTQDGIHQFKQEGTNAIILSVGSNVEYAIFLEKRYALFSRAMDSTADKMIQAFAYKLNQSLQ